MKYYNSLKADPLPLEELTIPTIIFHNKDDGLVDFEYGQYTAEHIPAAKICFFENGGLLVGQTDRIHIEILNFLRENSIIPSD